MAKTQKIVDCSPKEGNTVIWRWGLVSVIIVIGLWCLTLYTLFDKTETARGTYGDMFGGVNALFSGLAFAGIIITILLQNQELKRTADAQIKTDEALLEQSTMFKKQQFESAFFTLLQLHSEIVKNIDRDKKITIGVGGKPQTKILTVRGKDCFQIFYTNFKENVTKNNHPDYNAVYVAFYSNHQNDLGHYFRSLYHIIKFIDKSDINDKKRYASLIRAQLSAYELLLLFYNCLSEYGTVKFKPLINEYNLLKNINKNDLINPQHFALYDINVS